MKKLLAIVKILYYVKGGIPKLWKCWKVCKVCVVSTIQNKPNKTDLFSYRPDWGLPKLSYKESKNPLRIFIQM